MLFRSGGDGGNNAADAYFKKVHILDECIVARYPVDGHHVARKDYVDSKASGLNIKDHVQLATTGNINLYEGDIISQIDDVNIEDGDRILVKDQTYQSENGVYKVLNVSGGQSEWSRSDDFDSSINMLGGSYFFVDKGIINKNSSWVLRDNISNVDTDPIVFTLFSKTGEISVASNGGITKTANELSISYQAITNDMLAGDIDGNKIRQSTSINVNYLNTNRLKVGGWPIRRWWGWDYGGIDCQNTNIWDVNTLTSTNIISGTISASDTITSDTISGDTITSDTITSDTITSRTIASDTITCNGHLTSQSAFIGENLGFFVDISNGNIKMNGDIPEEDNGKYAVNRGYVDQMVEGLHAKGSVRYATDTNLTALYKIGEKYDSDHNNQQDNFYGLTMSVGSTIDISATDLKKGDRILVKNQSLEWQNGIYYVEYDNGKIYPPNQGGVGEGWPIYQYILKRTTDFSNGHEVHGSYVFVKHGKSKNMGYVLSSDLSMVTVGKDAIDFVIFNRLEDIHQGRGIQIIDETININFDNMFYIKSPDNKLSISGGTIDNALLTNSDITLGGVTISLGGDNPTPALD